MTVEAKNLSKWYGQVIGVNNLNFKFNPGVTGFLGPNGAGKTTLLRLLTGQLKPSKGTTTINGQPVWNNHKVNRNLGYCSEADAFWSYLTGRRFLESMLRLQGFTAAESCNLADQTMELVGISNAAHKRIGSYSKGMRQRIKLAQAIAHDPDIIFLDEPLNGMDPLGRKITIDLIKDLGNKGKTIIVSSHILHEVEEMTDNILLINHGRLLAHGNIYEIRALIDNHPLQVSLRCNNVSLLTAKLMAFDDIQSVQFDRENSQLTIETDNPEQFHKRLPGLALENNIKIQSMWSPDENLEAVFDYLVR